MKRIAMKIAALLTAVAVATGADAAGDYVDLMGKADAAIAAEDWATAEARLLEALRLEPANPSNVLLVSNLGIVRFNMGNDSLALATLDDAVEMAPRSATVVGNRALVLMGMGRLDEAYRDYATVMEIDTLQTGARFYHGIIAMTRRDTATARADFDRLIRLAPESFEANIGMATLCEAEGRFEEAVPFYNKVIAAEPRAEYYGARALCNLRVERLQEASEDIAEALRLDPADGELYLYRAILNKMRFRPDDAKADAERATALGVDKARVKALTGF